MTLIEPSRATAWKIRRSCQCIPDLDLCDFCTLTVEISRTEPIMRGEHRFLQGPITRGGGDDATARILRSRPVQGINETAMGQNRRGLEPLGSVPVPVARAGDRID